MTQLHTVASLDYGDGRTCVCRICECGKHSCPGIHVPFCGETTYRDEYVPKKAEQDRLRLRRHVLLRTKAEPDHYKTTKQEAAEQLAGKSVRPAASYKPRQTLQAPLPFDATTTHRADFPGHAPEYNRARRPQEALPKLKGSYETTKGVMDEPVKDLAQRSALPPPPRSCKSDDAAHPSMPFDGITSYTVEYPPKEVPLQRARQPAAAQPLPENRDFNTTSSETYKVPPLRMRHDCPAAFVPPRPPSRDGHIKLSVYNIPSGDTLVS